MKSKYCFIRDLGNLCPRSVVYQVWVGSSEREQIKHSLVLHYCHDVGIYFKKWSDEVDIAIHNAGAQWKMEGNVMAHPFRYVSISITQLYQLIIDDSFTTFEDNLTANRFEIWLNLHHRPDFISSINRLRGNTKCRPHRGLNLSLCKLTDGGKFLVGSLVILIIFLLDAIVRNVIVSLCGSV